MSHSNEKLQSSQNNKNFFGRANEKLTKITAGTLIALGAVGLSACAPTEAQPPESPVATETAEPTPSETEAPVERFGDFEWKDPIPEDLEYLDNMNAVEFAQQPKLEQLRWASWAGQYKDEFIDAWMFIGIGSVTEKYDNHYSLTTESDPFVAIQDLSYQARIATNFGVNNPQESVPDNRFNGKLNAQMASKYMTAHIATNNSSWRVEQFLERLQSNNSGQALNVSTQAMNDMYNYRQDAETDENFSAISVSHTIEGVEYNGWKVKYTDPDWGDQEYTVVVVPYTDYVGNQAFASVIF